MKRKALGLIGLSMLLTTPALADSKPDITQPLEAKTPGLSLKMSGISLDFGGFIEAMAIYRSKNENTDIASVFASVPTPGTAAYSQQQTTFSARQTRLWVLAGGDPNPSTHLSAYYEMDFQGVGGTSNAKETNSYTPRIRHLYTTADWDNLGLHLLAGQTFSLATLNNGGITPHNEVTPLTIDAQYQVGFTWARQPQVRITKDFLDKKLWLSASAELADTNYSALNGGTNYDVNITGAGNLGTVTSLSANQYPDFIVKAAAEPGWGHYEVYDLVRTLQSGTRVNGALSSANITTNAVGAGIILPIIPKYLTVMGSGLVGESVGRYGSATLVDATSFSSGELAPVRGSQFLTGITYAPCNAWDFYGYYGVEQVQSAYLGTSGYGLPNGANSLAQNLSVNGTTSNFAGQVMRVSEVTGGLWWKFYTGNAGRMQYGVQVSHLENKYSGAGAPVVSDNIAFTGLRYYWQ